MKIWQFKLQTRQGDLKYIQDLLNFTLFPRDKMKMLNIK